MCGFVGYLCGENKIDNEQTIRQMSELIAHRGPNCTGYHVSDEVALGFQRLSIIDLSDHGNQPLYSKDGQYVLLFNGEIYNHQDLRQELLAAGYSFQSETDSEVLVHGYAHWGSDLLAKLRGMYAFVIWDVRQKTLFMARDPFGIKPLYYGSASIDGTFFFGSEIKAFLAHPSFKKVLNEKALRSYMTFQYPATQETFFKGIYKLDPGTFQVVKGGQILKKERYWDFEFKADESMSMREAVQKITTVLKDSVKVHQIADVPVGAFLSGGIDSSFITALFKPKKTFSVGFKTYEGKFNETDQAKRLSNILGIEHYRCLIGAEDFFNALPTIQYHMDEPQSNLSSVPLYYLAQLASEHVKVVLSGEGADELFGGYDTYRESDKMHFYKHLPKGVRYGIDQLAKKIPNNRIIDFLRRGGEDVSVRYVGQACIFSNEEALALLKPAYRKGESVEELLRPHFARTVGLDDVTRKQDLDIRTWLPGDILLKADKMSSAHSLELRVPFLDKEVMKTAEKLPVNLRVYGQTVKRALRKAAIALLPEEWAKRPKNGFPVPLIDWLQEEHWADWVREYFTSDVAAQFFDQEKLLYYLDAHQAGRGQYQRYIYTVLTFLIWYDEYFVKR